jgi:hypothetical protein
MDSSSSFQCVYCHKTRSILYNFSRMADFSTASGLKIVRLSHTVWHCSAWDINFFSVNSVKDSDSILHRLSLISRCLCDAFFKTVMLPILLQCVSYFCLDAADTYDSFNWLLLVFA